MSVANLHYDSELDKYQIDLRMFVDDYLVVTGVIASESNYQPSMALVPSKREVRKYLDAHLFIALNGQPMDLKVDKVKIEDLTILVVFEGSHPVPPEEITSIDAEDTIFVDEFINQRNVLHVDLPNRTRKSILFNQYERKSVVEW
ncbi:MAG: hypothetical protein HKN87_12420 [Saprospiraceae bacterium]|nr:hypothetical protein [Saprospiraceae bacterium]